MDDEIDVVDKKEPVLVSDNGKQEKEIKQRPGGYGCRGERLPFEFEIAGHKSPVGDQIAALPRTNHAIVINFNIKFAQIHVLYIYS